MPNAKDITTGNYSPTFLMLGDTGAGKTTQFLTIPGKKFVYIFDPNALGSLRGHDLEYEEFYEKDAPMKLFKLKKGSNTPAPMNKEAAKVYEAWDDHASESLSNGFFDQFDVIGLDSFTTLSDLVMAAILAKDGRAGGWPQEQDWAPQMQMLSNIIKNFINIGKIVYVTGHVDLQKDEISKKIYHRPLMTGRLRTKLPLLFSDIFFLTPEHDGKDLHYILQTQKDNKSPVIRTSMKGLNYKEDITLDFSKPLTTQGLGAIMRKSGVI